MDRPYIQAYSVSAIHYTYFLELFEARDECEFQIKQEPEIRNLCEIVHFSQHCVHTVIVIPEDIYASTSSQRKQLDGSFL